MELLILEEIHKRGGRSWRSVGGRRNERRNEGGLEGEKEIQSPGYCRISSRLSLGGEVQRGVTTRTKAQRAGDAGLGDWRELWRKRGAGLENE